MGKMKCRVSLLKAHVWLVLLLGCLGMSSCYKMDDDGESQNQMLDRRMAQSYILSSYNQWCAAYPAARAGLEKLANLDSLLNQYQWEGKDEAVNLVEQCQQAILVGDLTAFRDALAYFKAHAGIYKADADKKFCKIEDADHQLDITFYDTTHLAFSWKVTEADDGNTMKVDLSLQVNDYLLSGSTSITNDSVGSSYRLTKGGVEGCLLTLQKTMKGEDFLEAVRSDNDSLSISSASSELRVQLSGGLCLCEKAGSMEAFFKFLIENKDLQMTNPKLYMQEYAKLRNELERTWLATPDGVVLCELFSGEVGEGEEANLAVYLVWNDDMAQTLTEFASSCANENFAKDMELLSKILL